MSTAPDVGTADADAVRHRHLLALLVGIALAGIAERFAAAWVRSGHLSAPAAQVAVSDLAVWLPLVAGAVYVVRRPSWRSATARLRPEWNDVVVALGIVVVTRVVDAALSISLFGSTGLTPSATVGTVDTGSLLLAALGTVLISPVLEEVFFRGLFQRRLADALTPNTQWAAVVVTAVVFAAAHLVFSPPASTLGGFQVFVTTLVLGLLAGTLVAMTGRIGGAILAHVLFNAVAVVATWPR